MNPPTTESVKLRINGGELSVSPGTTVAAAVFLAGVTRFRRSITGQPRAALCGMGICQECRVTIDGRAHARSCQIVCTRGMEVRTDD